MPFCDCSDRVSQTGSLPAGSLCEAAQSQLCLAAWQGPAKVATEQTSDCERDRLAHRRCRAFREIGTESGHSIDDFIEDLGLRRAIDEGKDSGLVGRDDVCRLLGSPDR